MSGFDRVRVRIAPSPTGDPHVGTAYVALFNYVFARKHGGDFILRIEDTDQARSRSSSERLIIESLNWLGLSLDEGPGKEGLYGPYRQSERKDIYRKYAMQLVEQGDAYYCFKTPEELAEIRKRQKEKGSPIGYDRSSRDLSEGEIKQKLEQKLSYVIRLKMPVDGVTVVKDTLRGDVEFRNEQIDDQVLLKSDGMPTYHLANVVDDHLMKISHVIRAEEWISSTPKHVQLYKAFGWDEPAWVHLPLLRNEDKSKISKRKNPVSLSYYQRAGILPEAMVNFLALMGWSFGNDVEIFSLEQMIERFDLKNLSLGGPVFDQAKLNWLNHQYLQKLDDDRFVSEIRDHLFSPAYLKALKPLVIERFERFDQFIDKHSFFFNGALNYDNVPLVPKGKQPADVRRMVKDLVERLDDLYEWDHENLKNTLESHRDELGWKPRDYFMTVRLIATGRKDSPPLDETLAVLGRDIVRFRLRHALSGIN